MNEAIQTLQDCRLHVDPGSTPVEVTSVLMKAEEDNLWKAFDELCAGAIGFNSEGIIQKVTVAYALAYAVENDLDSIDQEAVDKAQEKAVEIFESLEPEPQIEEEKPVTKRTRTPQLRGEMLQYIKDNPDETKQDVVDEFQSRYPEKSVNTLGQYYHSCRKEAGLAPNGTPGRQKADTMDIVKGIVADMTRDNSKVGVPELKEAVLKHPDITLSPASAQVYVYRARSELNN